MSEGQPDDRLIGTDISSPVDAMSQMMTGYWVSQAIFVVAQLGIADRLASGPMTYDHLAEAAGAHAPSLRRLLRALMSVGVFEESSSGHVALTPMAAALRTGTPDSIRALAMVNANGLYQAWGDLLFSIQTGRQAFEHHFGMPSFQYFAEHPEVGEIFNQAMVEVTGRVAAAVIEAYDFSSCRTLVDVGGGYGTLLVAIMQHHLSIRGILFDQPHVITTAEGLLTRAGIADRCSCVAGDFFHGLPDGGDTYLLSQILHDWDDDHCIAILTQCRQALPEHGRVLVVEMLVPRGPEPSFAKWNDLHMLAVAGGAERTAEEYSALFAASGLALARVLRTSAGPSVLEVLPV
jgi:O-methyltransferase domain/Dimerisation domain